MATRKRAQTASPPRPVEDLLGEALAALKAKSTDKDRGNLSRFGIDAPKSFGVSMSNIQAIAKSLGGRNHALAEALWDSGWYEARLMACYVDDPLQVTPAQMNRWRRDFDNWAVCDTACFVLFDRTPHAWAKAAEWRREKNEFQKRAAFAMIACLGVHDKVASDQQFLDAFVWIEEAALADDRHLVQKSISWAIRVAGRRNAALNKAAIAVAARLADGESAAARAIAKEVLRELKGAVVTRKLKR